jgi:hypothetical protein
METLSVQIAANQRDLQTISAICCMKFAAYLRRQYEEFWQVKSKFHSVYPVKNPGYKFVRVCDQPKASSRLFRATDLVADLLDHVEIDTASLQQCTIR